MTAVDKRHFDALAVGDAYLVAEFLPRCPTCFTKHPRAFNPPLDINHCPNCGGSLTTTTARLVKARITARNAWGHLAAALLAAGRFFYDLSERLKR